MKDKWDLGVVFIRGLNMYKGSRITKKKILELLKPIESDNLKIIGAVKADNILFLKRNIHYANITAKVERILTKYFNYKVYATARSARTLKSICTTVTFL